ncbi:MAG: S41 family peptidase [Bacteroidaceae bacterium]|nr:S41 family peptidase [Bacteroidaceae bacterium]
MKHTLTFLLLYAVTALPLLAQDKPKEDHSFSVSKNLDIFNTLYRKLDLFYVDTLDAEKLIQTGIDAMLSSLDPYTEYYADEDLGDLKMMTTGKYGGIGSIIRMRKDSTIIIAEPYEGMPAAEVGLKVGDVLKKIDGTDLKGKAVSEVSDLLRGEPGTTFVLRVQRPGEKKTRDFRITRRNIKVEPIPYYGLDGNIGYIALTQFTENCSADVRRAVISLKERGATNLVIDLRGNGGGLLNEAVSIVNLFVPKGLTIVETKGKVQMANSAYTTTAEPLDTITPLCILVSSSTASAAEIVAGSLQDLDRAVVIGTRTYGKGLVQSPQELPYNGQLKLTSSKYYIPSGRCIQAINYRDRRELGKDGRVPDSLTNVFKTRNGREVRDGGGIKPDIEVRHDTMANVVYYLSTDDVLTDWGTLYTQKHPTIPPIGTFAITEADFEQLKKMAREADFKYDRLSEKRLEDLKKMMEFEGYYEDATDEFKALEQKLTHNMERDFDRRRDDIIELMEQEIVKRYYYQRGVVEQALQHDDDLKRAHEILSQPDEYKRILQP